MMGNLIKAELWRVCGSLTIRIVALLGLVVGCWLGLIGAATARPHSAEELEIARAEYVQAKQSFEQEYALICGSGGTNPRSEMCTNPERWQPEVASFVRTVYSFSEAVDASAVSIGSMTMLVVAIVVGVLIGAEFSNGTLGTQLTFTPRRQPLLWAKTLVAGLTGLAITTWWMGVGFVMNIIGFVQVREVGELTSEAYLVPMFGRYLLVGLLAGVLTALLTITLGSTIRVAVVLAVTYTVSGIIESTIVIGAPESSGSVLLFFLPSAHLRALLTGQWQQTTFDLDGAPQEVLRIGYEHALIYVACWLVLLAGLAVVTFTRRDVLR